MLPVALTVLLMEPRFDGYGLVAGFFVEGGAALLEALEAEPAGGAYADEQDERDEESFHCFLFPAYRQRAACGPANGLAGQL